MSKKTQYGRFLAIRLPIIKTLNGGSNNVAFKEAKSEYQNWKCLGKENFFKAYLENDYSESELEIIGKEVWNNMINDLNKLWNDFGPHPDKKKRDLDEIKQNKLIIEINKSKRIISEANKIIERIYPGKNVGRFRFKNLQDFSLTTVKKIYWSNEFFNNEISIKVLEKSLNYEKIKKIIIKFEEQNKLTKMKNIERKRFQENEKLLKKRKKEMQEKDLIKKLGGCDLYTN